MTDATPRPDPEIDEMIPEAPKKRLTRRELEKRRMFLRSVGAGVTLVGLSLVGYFPVLKQLFDRLRPPKAGTKTASTPTKPAEPAMQWDTLNKGDDPGEGADEEMAEMNLLDGVDVRPETLVNLDTLVPYNPSNTFEHDLIHTKIEISFDWAQKRANGKATLTMRPWFYPM